MADELIRIEFRGIAGVLPIGATLAIESCEAGVLTVRVVSGATPHAADLEFSPSPTLPAAQAEPDPEKDA